MAIDQDESELQLSLLDRLIDLNPGEQKETRSTAAQYGLNGVGSVLISTSAPPPRSTRSGYDAAGYTVADVPTIRKQSARSECSSHSRRNANGIGSPNITVSLLTMPRHCGHVVGDEPAAAPDPLHVSQLSLRGIWIVVSAPVADCSNEISRS